MMNREILFKAKRKDNGEWVEGYYCKLDETTYCISEDYERYPVPTHHYILHETMTDWGLPNRFLQIEIDPDTLSQYTGLTDKNGKRIWENDILRYSYDYDGSPFLKDGEEIKYRVGAVFWSEWRGSWAVCGRGNKKCTNNDGLKYNRNPNRAEVIGNIFDNPEVLEV